MAEMELPNCFGPYLRYAIATDFKYFESFDDRGLTLKQVTTVPRTRPATTSTAWKPAGTRYTRGPTTPVVMFRLYA